MSSRDLLQLHTCVDVKLTPAQEAAARDAALTERGDNFAVVPLPGPPGNAVRLALPKLKRWRPGRTLQVAFLDGDPSVQARVEPIAHEWSRYANIALDFGPHADAEIRISFQYNGSWSTVGTDALTVDQSEATMNYGWLTPATDELEYRRVVLHEFGHAIGCIHEHQSPSAGIPWDKPKVYEYYTRTQGWTKDEVDHNLLELYSVSATNFTKFDPLSIMLYAIPDDLTVGIWSTGWNNALSATDKSFIGVQYPSQIPTPVELAVNGVRASATIGKPGDVDTFTFTVQQRRRHIITTEGPTNVLMTLHGPDDEASLVGADDDSGKAQNARIVRALNPGRYWLRVRHANQDSTGPYTVGVRAHT